MTGKLPGCAKARTFSTSKSARPSKLRIALHSRRCPEKTLPLQGGREPNAVFGYGTRPILALLMVLLAGGGVGVADSVVPWLGAFDAARVETASQWIDSPDDAQTLAEAAKLLYRMRRIERHALLQRASIGGPWQPGDAIALQGTASGLTAAPLPAELAEVLEMERVYRLTLSADGLDRVVITDAVPRFWFTDPQGSWPAAVAGMVIRSDAQGRPTAIATHGVQWYPTDPARVPRAGWAMLGGHGFDVGRLAEVIDADRQPLKAGEHDAFYAMLAAAQQAGTGATPPAQPVTAAQLLGNSQQWIGEWIRIDLETARLTRIAVAGPRAAQVLGSGRDHYWQIDGFADLGDVQVRLEPLEPDGQPVVFDNRYPVSLAALDLPAALQQAVEDQAGRGAVVAMVRRPVTVKGFFYRLWSYPSDYARSRGGGQPFGPLIMAADIQTVPMPTADPLGVAAIGWMAPAAFLVVLAVIVLWLWRVGRRDRQIALARRRREAMAMESAASRNRST